MFGNIISIVYLISLFVFVLIPYSVVIGETLIYDSLIKNNNAFGKSSGKVFPKGYKKNDIRTYTSCIKDSVIFYLKNTSKVFSIAKLSNSMIFFIVVMSVLFITAFGILVNMIIEYDKEDEEVFDFLDDVGNCVSLGIIFFIFSIAMIFLYESIYKNLFRKYLEKVSVNLTKDVLDDMAVSSSEKYGYSKDIITEAMNTKNNKHAFMMDDCNGRITRAMKDVLIKQNPQIGKSITKSVYDLLNDSSFKKKKTIMKWLCYFSSFPLFTLSILVYVILI